MEDVPIALWAQYLRARSAVHHPEREPDNRRWQAFFSAPQRAWIKAYRISPTHMRAEYHAECPCKLAG